MTPPLRMALLPLVFVLASPALADNGARVELEEAAGQVGARVSTKAEAVKGKAVAEQDIALEGCEEGDQKGTLAAIRNALASVGSCLPEYNKDIADEILKQFPKFKFSCDYQSRKKGGYTTHKTDSRNRLTSAHVRLTMNPQGEHYSLEARAFHEMIHAVDPPQSGERGIVSEGRFMISSKIHAQAGFPDVPYGCQFACYPRAGQDTDVADKDKIKERERKTVIRIKRILKEDGVEMPVSKKEAPCDGLDAEQCGVRQLYAGLCERGTALSSEKIVLDARRKYMPDCVAMGLMNACGEIDKASQCRRKKLTPLCGLRCQSLEADAEGKPMPDSLATRVWALAEAFVKVDLGEQETVSEDDKPYYDEAVKRKVLSSCR